MFKNPLFLKKIICRRFCRQHVKGGPVINRDSVINNVSTVVFLRPTRVCGKGNTVGAFHVGTSGWSYDHWKGLFYPEHLKAKDYFSFYTRHFDCVELNTSFYRLPKKKTVSHWKKQAPPDFIFCPKLSRFITHIKKLHDCRQPLKGFLEVFKRLKKQMGPILVQLPPRLKFDNPNTHAFFQMLKRFRSFTFAIEARDASWMSDRALDFIADKGMAWVIADWGNGHPCCEEVTSNTVYLRFHGPGAEYASKYSDRQLKVWARKTQKWLKEGKDVWAFFNNDGYGYAIQNAKTFKSMVGKK